MKLKKRFAAMCVATMMAVTGMVIPSSAYTYYDNWLVTNVNYSQYGHMVAHYISNGYVQYRITCPTFVGTDYNPFVHCTTYYYQNSNDHYSYVVTSNNYTTYSPHNYFIYKDYNISNPPPNAIVYAAFELNQGSATTQLVKANGIIRTVPHD